ncbi:ImmA/IrrE family metallo-endopeptidase [Ruminococcaceae bacterium OttesenSCG-928-N02]|nr:ImmA/IrrE family metallo-endopeptidase [Ruminococcaceae bacterium OttesenSCG-928-N02]
MVSLGSIFEKLNEHDIKLFTYKIGEPKALTMEMAGKYAIFVDEQGFETLPELNAAMIHELGHCATGATHHVSSPFDLVAKHENTANRWAFENYIPFEELNAAVLGGLREPWQLADWFGLPQAYIEKAIFYYTQTKQMKFGHPEEKGGWVLG